MDGKYQEKSQKTQKYKYENLTKQAAKKKQQANTEMTTPQPNDENSSAGNNSISNNGLSFSCKQTPYHSFKRANLTLLKSPNKKTEVIQRLLTIYKSRINLKKNRGRRCKALNEDEQIWLIKF